MNINQPVKIRRYLLPFSWIYGSIIYVRNKFFDWGIFKEKVYDIPIICVGNITAGGTGKTPHTEYIIKILQEKYKVGVISRGYRRQSKGFVLANHDSTSLDIGDEPYQIKQKFPDVIFGIVNNRRRGIEKLMALDVPPEVIVMDDGFQHRYVKPSFTILLSNFNRPIYKDKLLPAGLLREPMSSLHKAEMVIITKCPTSLSPLDYRIMTHDIDTMPYQHLLFTSFVYGSITSVFDKKSEPKALSFLNNKHILLVTGIASPAMIVEELNKYTPNITTLNYKDHHTFTTKDIIDIHNIFEYIGYEDKIILVTEKDAARLVLSNIDDNLKSAYYSLPVEISFSNERDKKLFKEKIYKHVKENKRNSTVY